MDAQPMDAMAEVTRLTSTGHVVEATELIQQALAASTPTRRLPDTPRSGHNAGTGIGWPAVALPRPVGGATAPGARVSSSTGRAPRISHRGGWPVQIPSRPGPAGGKAHAGRFDTFSYTNAAGTRSYRLYIPSGYDGRPVPLVVLLHGGTQDATTFAAATGMNDLAERDTFFVAYPQQARSANAGQYWNWFEPTHQHRGAGEASIIAGITAEVIERYRVDGTRVWVAGFSAGGAMAAVMAAAYPDIYAAVGVHSGLAHGSASDVASALAAMRHGPLGAVQPTVQPMPLIVFHGDRDTTVVDTNADCLIDQALGDASAKHAGRGITVVSNRGRIPGGHHYTRTCYQDPRGATLAERWTIHHGAHSWSGGVAHQSHTDPRGPNASAELIRFFNEHPAGA